MDEFGLINTFFRSLTTPRDDIIIGIGDDAACLKVPSDKHLLVSTDTLVAGVHFLETWDPYDIAIKALMVNISDIAAMAGSPCWASLALTLPDLNPDWLTRFALGLKDGLKRYRVALIGGDTTRGPLSITITIQGLVPQGKAVTRRGAKCGDKIYVSGPLGAAAQAVQNLQQSPVSPLQVELMESLLHPIPRVDLNTVLQTYATSAIDISDGLGADLGHICEESQVGARLIDTAIPIHPLLKTLPCEKALDLALNGGDDYELCFTVPANQEKAFLADLAKMNTLCFAIGEIEDGHQVRLTSVSGAPIAYKIQGYQHF